MKRRFALPLFLSLIGVMMLLGCIPIPTTRQFMTNGNLKPSWKIGSGPGNPVRLHYTTIDQAMVILDQQIFRRDTEETRATWRKIDDHTFAVPYNVRSLIVIWPLCFFADSDSDMYWLILKTDSDNHVIDFDTMTPTEFGSHYPVTNFLPPLLNEPQVSHPQH